MNPQYSNSEWASAFFNPPDADAVIAAEAEEAAIAARIHTTSSIMFPRYIDHSYHDYSTYIQDGGKIVKHKKSERNFPARLHTILSDEQYAHIISWMVSCCSANSRLGLNPSLLDIVAYLQIPFIAVILSLSFSLMVELGKFSTRSSSSTK